MVRLSSPEMFIPLNGSSFLDMNSTTHNIAELSVLTEASQCGAHCIIARVHTQVTLCTFQGRMYHLKATKSRMSWKDLFSSFNIILEIQALYRRLQHFPLLSLTEMLTLCTQDSHVINHTLFADSEY